MKSFLKTFILSIFISSIITQIKIPVTKERTKFISTSRYENEKFVPNEYNSLFPEPTEFHTVLFQNLSNFENLQYFGSVTIGSEDQEFKILFDSGSDTFWVPSYNCKGCPNPVRFDCENSETCVKTNITKKKTYSVGYVDGFLVNDMLGLTPDLKVNYTFLLVSNASSIDNFSADGLMGLSPLTNISDFIDYLYDGGHIKDKVFSFYMDNNILYEEEKQVTTDSYLAIGEIPDDHVNNLVWLPLVPDRHWVTSVLQIKVDDQIINTEGAPNGKKVMLDTGTSTISLSTPVYKALFQELAETEACISDQGVTLCLCNEEYIDYYPNITFTLPGINVPGVTFNITARQYMINPIPADDDFYCFIAVLQRRNTSDSQVLGDVFFRAGFTTFSKRNQTMGIDVEGMVILTSVKKGVNMLSGVSVIAILVLGLVFAKLKMRNFEKKVEIETASDGNETGSQSFYDIYKQESNNHFPGATSSL